MPDIPNFDVYFRIGRDEVLIRNGQLSLQSVERNGTDANVVVASGAAMSDQVMNLLAAAIAGAYLDSAEKDALDRLVFDRYGLVRKQASPALGSVTFSTTAPAAGAFTIPKGTVLETSSGLQYVTTIDVTFPMSSTGPVVVAVRSVLAGANQQAKIGTITNITSQISGQPDDLVVTNTIATAGAADVEGDPSLRNRARRFFVTARRGTISAIEAGALNVAGVANAKAFEVLDQSGRPGRLVNLVVSDPFTEQLVNVGSVPAGYQAQSQQLALQVFQGLDDVRAAGIYVQTIVGVVVMLPIRLDLKFQAGSNPDDVAILARTAVVNYVNALGPGDPVTVKGMLNALQVVPGLFYTGAEIASPVGDTVPKALQVLRTTINLVTASSVQPNRPITNTANPDAYAVA